MSTTVRDRRCRSKFILIRSLQLCNDNTKAVDETFLSTGLISIFLGTWAFVFFSTDLSKWIVSFKTLYTYIQEQNLTPQILLDSFL